MGQGRYLYVHGHDKIFFNLLDAIKTQNEKEFLAKTVDLAAVLGGKFEAAKQGFIETMAYLFVAKKFQSPKRRQE